MILNLYKSFLHPGSLIVMQIDSKVHRYITVVAICKQNAGASKRQEGSSQNRWFWHTSIHLVERLMEYLSRATHHSSIFGCLFGKRTGSMPGVRGMAPRHGFRQATLPGIIPVATTKIASFWCRLIVARRWQRPGRGSDVIYCRKAVG